MLRFRWIQCGTRSHSTRPLVTTKPALSRPHGISDTHPKLIADRDTEAKLGADCETETKLVADRDTESKLIADRDTESKLVADRDTESKLVADRDTSSYANRDTSAYANCDTSPDSNSGAHACADGPVSYRNVGLRRVLERGAKRFRSERRSTVDVCRGYGG